MKIFTQKGVKVNFYTRWCNGQHSKEYPFCLHCCQFFALKSGCFWYKLPGKLSSRKKKNGIMWEFFPPGQPLNDSSLGGGHSELSRNCGPILCAAGTQPFPGCALYPRCQSRWDQGYLWSCTQCHLWPTTGLFGAWTAALFEPSGKVPTKKTIAEGRFATCQPQTRPPRRWLSMLSLSPLSSAKSLLTSFRLNQGCSSRPTPPRGKTGCPAPPCEIDKTRGAQRGKTDCRFH